MRVATFAARPGNGMIRSRNSRRLISLPGIFSGRWTCCQSRGRSGPGGCTRTMRWICWSSGSPAWTTARWNLRERKSKGVLSEARGVPHGDRWRPDAAAMMALLIVVLALVVVSLSGLVIFTAVTARRVEKALPPGGRFIEVAGARIHYLDKDSGPAIVILHGLGGQMGNFTYALLERLTGEFRVILMERPGSGYSTRAPRATGRLTEQAAIVAEFIRKLELERPLLVGHSLGGAIALGVALDHPEVVKGLALIAPLTHVPRHVPAPFRALDIKSNFLRWLLAWALCTPLGIRRGKAILDAIFSPEPAPADFPTRAGGILGLRPRSFYNTSKDMRAVSLELGAMVGG